MSEFFDYDDHTGILETVDKQDGKIYHKKSQDVSSYIKQNQAEILNESGNWKGEFHKVASIPPIFAQIWREELKRMGAECDNPFDARNKTFLIAKLNSGEFAKFRTKSGKL